MNTITVTNESGNKIQLTRLRHRELKAAGVLNALYVDAPLQWPEDSTDINHTVPERDNSDIKKP